MTVNKTVRLQITSESEGQRIQQYFTAELYLKGTHIYIRYREVDPEMGNTTTTLKFAKEEEVIEAGTEPESDPVRIIRHGDIQSEQSFTLRKHRVGFYQTPQGNMDLETFTHSIALNLDRHFRGEVVWRYDLFVSGELAGTYDLKVEILADRG